MGALQLALTGIPELAKSVLRYRSTPVIAGTPNTSKGVGKVLVNAVTGGIEIGSGIYLYAETYDEAALADVSKQLIMASDNSRKWVADNIAPQPRTWDISGYLKAMVGNVLQVPTQYLTGPILLAQKKKLLEMQRSRATYMFKTTDNEMVPHVAIVELHFSPTAQAGNALPFTIKLQEMPYLSATETGEDPDQTNAVPAGGSPNGTPIPMGKAPSAPNPALVKSGIPFPSWMGK